MKKALIILLLSGLYSCKKDRVCECDQYYNEVKNPKKTITTYKGVSKSQAKNNCVDYTADYGSFTVRYDCTLK